MCVVHALLDVSERYVEHEVHLLRELIQVYPRAIDVFHSVIPLAVLFVQCFFQHVLPWQPSRVVKLIVLYEVEAVVASRGVLFSGGVVGR